MKKILAIVLLSVVMLSVMIVPSFASTLDELGQEQGLNGYYTLNLNDPLNFDGIIDSEYTSNEFNSFFSLEDFIIYVSGQLKIISLYSDSALIYYSNFDVYSSSDIGNSLIGGPKYAKIILYSSTYFGYNDVEVGPDVLENLQMSYNIIITEYPYLAESLSYDTFVLIFTNFADSTRTPIVESDNTVFQQFMNNNTTFTATNSILELPAPPPPPPIVIKETGNVFTSVISWAGTFVNTVFNNTGLLILFLLGVGISIVLVVIRILRKVMWSN